MTEWRSVRVGEVAQLINGDRGKNYPAARHRTASGIPFINAGHLHAGRVRFESMDFIPPERYQLLRSGKVEVDDILLCIRGSIGRWALVTPNVVPGAIASSLVILRSGSLILPQFLGYHIASPEGSRSIMASNNGAAQPNVGAQQLASLTISLPTLEDQRRIVKILGSIDELIENNRRRIQILEEMARAIYREWFVKFRYPSHNDVPMVDSALGWIPRGWQVVPSSTAITVNPRIKLDKSVNHPFISMADLDERTLSCRPSGVRSGGSGAKFELGDTLFARITPCLQNGKIGLVQSLREDETGLGSTEFIVLRGRLVGSAYTYCLAREESFRAHAISSMSGASGRQRVRNECFDSYLLALPPRWLVDEFESLVDPLLSSARVLLDESERLSDLRDLLLPQLMTGQIDVSMFDLDFEVGRVT